MIADLSGVDAKIAWSKTHLAALNDAIADTITKNPPQFPGEMDQVTGEYVIRVRNLPAVDPTWSLRIGDVVHNLRSALDHLAWQLVILDGKTPRRGQGGTQFPILNSPPKNDAPVQLRPAITNPQILEALEAVQPYHRFGHAEDQLWRLNQLDIIDKHRLLLVVERALNVGSMWWGWWGEHEAPSSVFLNSSPLKEGDVIGRFDMRGHEPPAGWDPHPDISIVIYEEPVLDLAGFAIGQVLNSFVKWVEDYVLYDNFRPLFPT